MVVEMFDLATGSVMVVVVTTLPVETPVSNVRLLRAALVVVVADMVEEEIDHLQGVDLDHLLVAAMVEPGEGVVEEMLDRVIGSVLVVPTTLLNGLFPCAAGPRGRKTMPYGYESKVQQPPEYWRKAKEDAWQRDHAWEIGYALVPEHPSVTGEKKCWLCLKDSTEQSLRFDVEKRLGDFIFLPQEERAALRAKGQEEVENKVSTCEFCNMSCYMKGWPAVRRDFILAGGRAKPNEAAAAEETK